MNRNFLLTAVSIVIVFQFVVLAGEYINAVYPLWVGQEIKLKTVPVDPRSLFRGNYARLRYEISSIKTKDINELKIPRNGERIYIKLKAEENGIYVYEGVSLNKPGDAVFIRGRIQTDNNADRLGNYQVKYGIEAYFTKKKKAIALEKKLRNKAFAKVMIAKNGKAALSDVLSE